jgi:hypothetical protein
MSLMRDTLKRAARLIPPIGRIMDQRDRALLALEEIRAGRESSYPFASVLEGDKLQETFLEFLSLFTPRRAIGARKVRVGRPNDGGYVLLDDMTGVACALSFGIHDDCSWDLEIADRGIAVYQFDPSIEAPPVPHSRFHFFKKRISADQADDSESLDGALAMLPSGGPVVLKLDIEGSEWEMFEAASVDGLRRISQIVCEFHNFSKIADARWRRRATAAMMKLKSVFEVVHIHGNNYGPMLLVANVPFPEYAEVTLANRALWRFDDLKEVFPALIDQPNRAGHPDLFLGTLTFRNL